MDNILKRGGILSSSSFESTSGVPAGVPVYGVFVGVSVPVATGKIKVTAGNGINVVVGVFVPVGPGVKVCVGVLDGPGGNVCV